VAWLTTGEFAQERIDSLATRGYVPGNFAEFQSSTDEVRDFVQHLEWANLATQARRALQSEELE